MPDDGPQFIRYGSIDPASRSRNWLYCITLAIFLSETTPTDSADEAKTKVNGDQQEFKRWAKKYVLDPNPHLRVTADDLYGGRCG